MRGGVVVAPPPSECVCGGEEADTFRFVTFRFVTFRFVTFRFVIFCFVTFCFVTFRFVTFRFVTFCFCAEAVAFRAAAGHAPFRPLYDGRSSVVVSGRTSVVISALLGPYDRSGRLVAKPAACMEPVALPPRAACNVPAARYVPLHARGCRGGIGP